MGWHGRRIMMPGESGLDLARDLKSISPIPICMLTARAEPENRVEGLEAGVDDYVTKPFEPRELVLRLNRVGIVVDSPHSGIRTTLDAAATTRKPMMASHTGARAVFDHMRCKTDEELRAIADTDGLIGVYVLPNMLGPEADLNTLLDHVDYIARLVGPDHVAIGTDTCYQPPWPEGLQGFPNARFSGNWWGNWKPDNHPLPHTDEASRGSLAWTNWPLYTVGLVQRGYSDQDIARILGGNLLRVLDANRPEQEYRQPLAPAPD